MKKMIDVGRRTIIFYSINLCNYDNKGDYELFPVEKLELDILRIGEKMKGRGISKWSKDAGQFSLESIDITIYKEGRVIMEGVIPDTHERAFLLLRKILSF